ncbi:hypothetical protein V3C99_007927, partial [Haemonchus contortus]
SKRLRFDVIALQE